MKITNREATILIALAETGGSNSEIASKLGIAENSVKVYLVKLRKKLEQQGIDVSTRIKLYEWAKECKREYSVDTREPIDELERSIYEDGISE